MRSLAYQHISNELRLFIDSSKTSLKAVLLHNGNTKSSVPVGIRSQYKNELRIYENFFRSN